MAKTTQWAGDLLKLYFNATAIANIAQNNATSPITSVHVSLLTADPGTTGDQTTNEVDYTNYARVAVARTSGGWTVSTNSCSPVDPITFPEGGAGTSPVAAYLGLGTLLSGAGVRQYNGAIVPSITCGEGITPSLTTGTTITEL